MKKLLFSVLLCLFIFNPVLIQANGEYDLEELIEALLEEEDENGCDFYSEIVEGNKDLAKQIFIKVAANKARLLELSQKIDTIEDLLEDINDVLDELAEETD